MFLLEVFGIAGTQLVPTRVSTNLEIGVFSGKKDEEKPLYRWTSSPRWQALIPTTSLLTATPMTT
jgi:hypothetical protein